MDLKPLQYALQALGAIRIPVTVEQTGSSCPWSSSGQSHSLSFGVGICTRLSLQRLEAPSFRHLGHSQFGATKLPVQSHTGSQLSKQRDAVQRPVRTPIIVVRPNMLEIPEARHDGLVPSAHHARVIRDMRVGVS